MKNEPDAAPDGPGFVQIAVQTRTADGSFREEARLISVLEWRLDCVGLRQAVLGMVDRAAEAAAETERRTLHVAGPKGHLP